jgi:hypothetical protein
MSLSKTGTRRVPRKHVSERQPQQQRPRDNRNSFIEVVYNRKRLRSSLGYQDVLYAPILLIVSFICQWQHILTYLLSQMERQR